MLVHVSAGYLPVRGWLHTCYSPVRRSPPVYCYTVLPLDLHVLSLSLAFILSQDQTLHTKIIFQKSYLAGSCVHESRLPSIPIHARYVVIFTSILLKNSSCHLHRRRFFRSESGCKDKAMIPPFPNFFTIIFHLFSINTRNYMNRKTLQTRITLATRRDYPRFNSPFART